MTSTEHHDTSKLVGARVERPAATLLAVTGFLGATILRLTVDGRSGRHGTPHRPGGVTPPTAA